MDWEATQAYSVGQTMAALRENLIEEIEIRSAHTWNFLALLPPKHAAHLLITALAPTDTQSVNQQDSGSMTLHSLVEELTAHIVDHHQSVIAARNATKVAAEMQTSGAVTT